VPDMEKSGGKEQHKGRSPATSACPTGGLHSPPTLQVDGSSNRRFISGDAYTDLLGAVKSPYRITFLLIILFSIFFINNTNKKDIVLEIIMNNIIKNKK